MSNSSQTVDTSGIRILGKMGTLVARFASNPEDLERAQALRYLVFKSEHLEAPAICDVVPLDTDDYDAHCEHLLIEDTSIQSPEGNPLLVGTYRILHQDALQQTGKFYSQSEFDVAALVKRHGDLTFLELGRSCVLPDYRSRRTIELMWHGIWAHVVDTSVDVMFGCASFAGTDINAHAEALSYLHVHHGTGEGWHVKANPDGGVSMNIVPADSIDIKRAFRSLPPLIKGYLRLGASFAGEAALDEDFGSVDVLVVLPVRNLSERYLKHYGNGAERFRT